jgi:hydroxymethylbilane synthase
MLPAAGQGALGIEIRADRPDVAAALAPLAHQSTWLCVTAERAVSRAMGGSCSMPLAAHAHFDGEYLQLHAAWGDPERAGVLVRARGADVIADLEQAAVLGEQVAARLRAGGAR